MCVGVPSGVVEAEKWTHHQLLQDYEAPLGYGNNMFISVSSVGDADSAPLGHRAMMISTHCDVKTWQGLTRVAYRRRKEAVAEQLHQHHALFPEQEDPEGDPARMGFWQAVAWGPIFLPRLWWWAWRRTRAVPRQRRWLAVEAGWFALFWTIAVGSLAMTPAVLLYGILALVGSWAYPLLTVHLPHRNYGSTPLTQTHTLRGWILPRLFLELTYHLEHHLYPQVPSHL